MRLTHLRLTNFRNLAEVELEVPSGVSVYFGQNAQGKTALVEAVYILAIARSFRAENERELVNFAAAQDGGQALVDGLVDDANDPSARHRVIIGWRVHPHPNPPPIGGGNSGNSNPPPPEGGNSGNSNPPQPEGGNSGSTSSSPQRAGSVGGAGYRVSKEIRVNRVRYTAGALVGLFHAVLFSVQDVELVQGPPSGRRRFLDILASQADPAYLKSLQRYQQVLRQRNRLLRLRREGRAGQDELEFWDGELVREGSWLTGRRQDVLGVLTPALVRHFRDLSGPGEELQLLYRPSVPLPHASTDGATTGADPKGLADNYREALRAAWGRERATAATAVGPHRDDFGIFVNGIDMDAYASRGQARTLALGLRLAEAETLAAVRGTGPILLLDDALSEMDDARRRRVLEKASQYPQVLITATDYDQLFAFFGDSAAYFKVEGGCISPYVGPSVR